MTIRFFAVYAQKSLTFVRFWHNKTVFPDSLQKRAKGMFKDVLDFGKKRTGKEAVQFVIFHGVIVLAVMAGLSLLGIS